MTLIILLLIALAMILICLYSQVRIGRATSRTLDNLDTDVDLVVDKLTDLEHRVTVLERKIVSMEGKDDQHSMQN